MFKKLLTSLAVLPLLATGAVAETYNVDTAHSQIHFTVAHLVAFKVRGNFTEFNGSVVANADSKELVAAEATIKAHSIDTRDEKRDGHLRSADFFATDKFPEITFKSKKVTGSGDNITVVGDLTIKGITKEVVLTGGFAGAATDPWGHKRAGFEATGEIDRKDFGLTWNKALETGGVLVGDKITIGLEVEAVAQE